MKKKIRTRYFKLDEPLKPFWLVELDVKFHDHQFEKQVEQTEIVHRLIIHKDYQILQLHHVIKLKSYHYQ